MPAELLDKFMYALPERLGWSKAERTDENEKRKAYQSIDLPTRAMKVLVPRSELGSTSRPRTKPAGGRSARKWKRVGQRVARSAQNGSASVGVEAVATGAMVAQMIEAAGGPAAGLDGQTGTWLCTEVSENMEELVKALGLGWMLAKVAAGMGFGVNKLTQVVSIEDGTLIQIAKGTPQGEIESTGKIDGTVQQWKNGQGTLEPMVITGKETSN
jgi:hypothetical protein